MQKYKIADIVFDASFHYSITSEVCKNYLYSGEEAPEVSFFIENEDVEEERKNSSNPEYSNGHFECLALYRKFLTYALSKDTLIIHSSAIAVDGNGYLFVAPSGTGKSTHTALWRELFKDKAVMINDDKPVVRKVDGEFFVYGTPWNGKHRLDTNAKAKVKAVCLIKRGKTNHIREISKKEMLLKILNQTMRPRKEQEVGKVFELIEGLLDSVGLYELECNISLDAAKLSYSVMSEKKYED